MVVASDSDFIDYCDKFPQAAKSLRTWRQYVGSVTWRSPSELKSMYRSASILKRRRVIFNIGGNKFRLITYVSYSKGIIYLIWFGTHKDYDKINAQEIGHVAD